MKSDTSIIHSRWLARCGSGIARLSPWQLALLLSLPALALRLFSFSELGGQVAEFLSVAVLFIAGAFQRLNRQQMLIMLGLAGAWFALNAAITRFAPAVPYPYFLLLETTVPVFVVGIGEWFLTPARNLKSLLWVFVLAVAVGCTVSLILKPLDFTDATVIITGFGRAFRPTPWGYICFLPLQVTLAWVAIPTAVRLGEDARRFRRFTAAALALASVVAFFLFFDNFVYTLANASLSGNGPFGRSSAASILETKVSRADQKAIWTALKQADWSKEYEFGDYREAYIDLLAKQDPPMAARRLSEMVRAKPSRVMARFCAQLFAEQHEYETVPLLMRYSLQGDDECTQALERMQIPQAALAIIRDSSVQARPNLFTADFRISQKDRGRLTRLLGKDAGPNLSDWTRFYDSKAPHLQILLPEDVATESKTVVNAMVRYWNASNRLYVAQSRLFVQRLKDSGNQKLIDQWIPMWPLLQSQKRFTDSDVARLNIAGTFEMNNQLEKAFADMSVAQPDWNVASTAGLEREVQRYSEQVDAVIAKYRSPATLPAPADE